MATSRLLKSLFQRRSNKEKGSDKAIASSDSTPSASTLSPLTREQLIQGLESHPQAASPFFSLPGELRNKIYSYATYPALPSITIYKSPEAILSCSIFHICRRIRSEAISHLCASKFLHLASIWTANKFFELVRDELPSLRHVTIRCAFAWHLETEKVEVEKRDLLDFLELATGLKALSVVIEDSLGSAQNETNLEDPESVGARFLQALRDVVDRETCGAQEDTLMRERLLNLCKQRGVDQAVRSLKEEVREEHERQGDRVFRLFKVTRLGHTTERIVLPVQVPVHLRRIEMDMKKQSYDRRDVEN